MGVKYLLPCECGKQMEVDSSQSGLRVPCECGQQMEVPTHRGLRQLARAETPPETAASKPESQRAAAAAGWGRRQGALSLAVILLLMAAGLWGWVHSRIPEDPWPQAIAEAEPQHMLTLWAMMHRGVDITGDDAGQSLKKMYESVKFWKNIAYALAGAAGVAAVVALLIPNRPAKK
ncbi:MAG: hypothetical protein AB7O62_05705 [Pirellulales bacterium]